jgi:arabinose-5-phosphate isomerase
MDFKKIAREVLEIEANELLNASLNGIEKAVEIIFNTKGKLIITGVGKSGLIGSKMAATFASTGTSSFFIHPTEALHGDLGMIGENDTVIAISNSGESEELIKILPHIKRFNIPLISMSGNKNSSLASYADINIDIKVSKEACPLNSAPTSSTTLTLAIGDALAVCLMKKRDFKKEDFASFHPGGTLGKKLFVKVDDLMRQENLPIADKNIKLKDAIIKMSEGKLGSIIFLEDQKPIALLSDGDLRRAILRDDFDLDHSAINYASKNPKIIENKNMLASDAIKILEEKKIQLLIITENGKLIGLLHIHDLVEAGIK